MEQVTVVHSAEITKLADLIAERIEAEMCSRKPLVRWVRLTEAARYASIGQKRLKELAKEGSIVGFPDPDSKRGDWIFDLHSLDAYREGQAAGSGKTRLQALDILRSVE